MSFVYTEVSEVPSKETKSKKHKQKSPRHHSRPTGRRSAKVQAAATGTNTHPSDTDGSVPSDSASALQEPPPDLIRGHKKLEREERWVAGPDLQQDFGFRTRSASADSDHLFSTSKPMQLDVEGGSGRAPKMSKRDLERLSYKESISAKTSTDSDSLLAMIKNHGIARDIPRESAREQTRKGKRRLSSSRRRSQDRGSPKFSRNDVRNSPKSSEQVRENRRRQKMGSVEPAPETKVELLSIKGAEVLSIDEPTPPESSRERGSIGSIDSQSSLVKEVLGDNFLKGSSEPSLPSTRIRRTRSTPSSGSVQPSVRSTGAIQRTLPKSNTSCSDTSMMKSARNKDDEASMMDELGLDRPTKKSSLTRTELGESFDNLMRNMLIGGVRIEPEEVCSSSHTLTSNQKLDSESSSSSCSEDDSTLVSERSAFLGSDRALSSSRSTSSSTGLQWLFGIEGEQPLDQGKPFNNNLF